MPLQLTLVALNAFSSNLFYMKSLISSNMNIKDSMDEMLQVPQQLLIAALPEGLNPLKPSINGQS